MFKQDGREAITFFWKIELKKDLPVYSANNNTNFQDSLLVENIVYFLELAKEIIKMM